MPKRASVPSAHDVARRAGVSQAAVSRAFTPGASIAKETQARIFRAAKTLGYRPNLLARSLNKGQSGIVGVIIGNARNPLFMTALDSLSVRLSPAGKHILVFTADSAEPADVQVEDLLKYRVDALLLVGASVSASLIERCREDGIPITGFNRPTRKTSGFNSVTGNNRQGARLIAEHLLEQGYRRLAVIAGFAGSSTVREREAGFNACLTSRGLPQPMREIGHGQREGAMQATRRLLARTPRPDAIFCANDYMALAALEVARYEFGLKIGREIGIAGFDDLEQAAWPSFDLTTYSLPLDAMLDQVVKILLNPPPPGDAVHVVVDGALRLRGSTRRQ